MDNSPAVRDAAIELIGKHALEDPEIASEYYPKIAERIAVSVYVHEMWISLTLRRIPELASVKGS